MNPSDPQYNPLCRRGLSPMESALGLAIIGLPLLAVVGLMPWFMKLEQDRGRIARVSAITPAAAGERPILAESSRRNDTRDVPGKVVELAVVTEGRGE